MKTTSEGIGKTIAETSINNNKALEISNEKPLEIVNDRGITASFLLSPLSRITNPKNFTQFKRVKILTQTESMTC